MPRYAPAIQAATSGRAAVFALPAAVEQDDNCANIYHKPPLYPVSNAFEEKPCGGPSRTTTPRPC